MKKFMSVFLASVLCLVLASGLVLPGPATVQAEEKVSIRQAIWDVNQEPFYDEAIALFNEENPNIEIVVEITPWAQYWTKLEAAATGGSIADSFWINGPNITLYATGGIAEPLDARIEEAGIDLTKYPEALVELYNIEGNQYAIPKDFDTIAVFYNKELFDEAGVDYPESDWTWEDMMEKAEALTDTENNIYGLSAINSNQSGYYNPIYASGGFIISEDMTTSGYDDPKSIEGMKLWAGIMEAGVSPSLAVQEDTPARTLFSSGNLAMLWDGSWRVSEFVNNEDIAGKFDIVELPSINGTKASVIHGLGHAMSTFSENQDAVWTWQSFLATKEANDLQATTAAAIPAHEDSTSLWTDSFADYNLEAFTTAAEEYSARYPVSKNSAVWNQMEIDTMKRILNGEIDAEEGSLELAKSMNEALADE